MSYNAFGSGTLEFLDDLDLGNIKLPLDDFRYQIFRGSLEVEFPDQKYWDEDVKSCLENIKPLIKSGKIEFIGEDDARWCFVFDEDGFHEERGEIIYETELETLKRKAEALRLLLEQISDQYETSVVLKTARSCGLTDSDLESLGFEYILDTEEE